MRRAKRIDALLAMFACAMVFAFVGTARAEPTLEKFDAKNFERSTVIDNEWFPIKPGMRYVWDGFSVDEEGDEEPHSTERIVTDLVKVIAGVRTVVCLERDIIDGELEEAEIMFLAQDKNGDVWLLGEYPEEYDNKKFAQQVSWMHGCKDGHAGIIMKKEPKVGMTYSQGWSPSVEFTDVARVDQVGQEVNVPAGDFQDVLVIEESDKEAVGTHHLKYYARGTGLVRVAWRGKESDQETMNLVKVEKIRAEEMAEARAAALELDRHGYEVSKDVYALTQPIEAHDSPSASQQ